jgi:hypothetical protein
MICAKCKTENTAAAKYCSHCGTVLPEEVVVPVATVSAQRSGTHYFSESEVKILLEINEKTVKSGANQSSVSQTDIDKLFG